MGEITEGRDKDNVEKDTWMERGREGEGDGRHKCAYMHSRRA